jgi:transmembrane sensor
MTKSSDESVEAESIRQQAAAWVLRRDRGLTAVEQDELSAWLAADARHGEQLAKHRLHWSRLDQLAEWKPEHSNRPNPDLLAPPLRFRMRRSAPVSLALAAAAMVTIVITALVRAPDEKAQVLAPAIASRAVSDSANQRLLEDGSIIELNRGAIISVEFTADERRVRLDQGEAHFAVAKDAVRPFIVSARGVDVRAVGTAFNVRVDLAAVEVLVTEGRVQLNSGTTSADLGGVSARSEQEFFPLTVPEPRGAFLEARQRAVVSLAAEAPPPQIATLTLGEIERVLAWQHRLLDFTGQPLHAIVAEFNRRNVVQLVLIDPELAGVRVSASIRSDNVEGFVRLLEAGFGASAERRGDAEILLRRAR